MLVTQKAFTLLEVLIAMTILTVLSASLSYSIQQNQRLQAAIQQRTLARWVAMNEWNQMTLDKTWLSIGEHRHAVDMANQKWEVRLKVESSPYPEIRQLSIGVRLSKNHRDRKDRVSAKGDLYLVNLKGLIQSS